MLENKVVVISGVGPALGTTLARRCEEAGADLVLAARTAERLTEVADQVKSMGAEFVGIDFREDGSGSGGYAKDMSEGYRKAQSDTFALQAKDVRTKFANLALEITPTSPREFEAHLKSELEKWGKVVKAAGIKPE